MRGDEDFSKQMWTSCIIQTLVTQIRIHWSEIFHILKAKCADPSDLPVKTFNLQQVRGKFICF